MRPFLFVVALLVALFSTCLSSVGSAAAASQRANLDAGVIDEALAAHNALRQSVAQAESLRLGGTVVIPDLTWDPDLAILAQSWADFRVGQVPPYHRPDDQRPGIGENLYWWWNSPEEPDQSPTAAVQSWASEQQYYDYDSNTCAAPDGASCGHYTQLVWSATERVGCGRAVWTTEDGQNHVIWVCNYGPAGNIIGERPYSASPAPVLAISPDILPDGTVDQPYALQFTASGGTGPYAFALTAGNIPAGLNLDGNGLVSGTPSGSGSFSFTITVTDAEGVSASLNVGLTIVNAPQLGLEQRLVDLVNSERQQVGCAPLAIDPLLTQAALAHTQDMATHNFMSHTGSDGSQPDGRIAATGYAARSYGENVAAGQTTAEEVMASWMNSEGHRANILDCAFVHIGVAHDYNANSDYGHYWTQVFAAPMD
jgi:uncharacterized protein YkwD